MNNNMHKIDRGKLYHCKKIGRCLTSYCETVKKMIGYKDIR